MVNAMRNKFDLQLQELNDNLVMMGALCENAISLAVKSLLDGNTDFAKKAIEEEKEIDRVEKNIEALCLRLLLQQQPVARDLRIISAALKMITDIERIGDQAADIAEIGLSSQVVGVMQQPHIKSMALAAIKMVTDAIDAFVRIDLTLAHDVILRDDEVDTLFLTVRGDIINLIAENKDNGAVAMDVLMIAKYLERIADHATNIAEWVVFSITGVRGEE